VSGRLRTGLMAVSGAGFAALLAWGLAGLPDFGHYAGPYGDVIAQLAKPQRSMANAITATVFDYRGFDTMGEELILVAAATSTALLLRDVRETQVEDVVDRVRSDAVRAVGALIAILTFVLGLQVVAHGFVTPGGGFQGGVVLSAAFAFLFLAIEYRAYNTVACDAYSESAEGLGALAFVAFGIVALGLGLGFLQNFIRHGMFGRVQAGGSMQLVNWSAGVAVAAAFLVVYGEYLQEAMAGRHK
jgi:multicomponent Na+:H+ antiporter subunit B